MKKPLIVCAIIALACSPINTKAQVLNPPPPPPITNSLPYFWETATTWLTTLNTNSVTWSTDRGSIYTGADYISGVASAATLGGTFNIGSSFELRGEFANAGIAGTIVGAHAGVGYRISNADLRMTPYAVGGYDFYQRRAYISPGIELRKAMTGRTFAYIGARIPIYIGHAGSAFVPTVSTGVGFTFAWQDATSDQCLMPDGAADPEPSLAEQIVEGNTGS